MYVYSEKSKIKNKYGLDLFSSDQSHPRGNNSLRLGYFFMPVCVLSPKIEYYQYGEIVWALLIYFGSGSMSKKLFILWMFTVWISAF